jgi:uncharacterized DUF497 family protein
MYIFAIDMKEEFDNFESFDWDSGNSDKNWVRHQVTQGECEQVFFNEPIIVSADEKHSQSESRWYLLGTTDSGRLLVVVFTKRKNKIRIISARNMNKKERNEYNEQAKKNTGF